VLRVCAEWGLEPDRIVWEPRIYEAPPGDLLTVLGETDTAARTVLMVGHNPGTELLIRELTDAMVPADKGDKAVPTGTVAHIRFDSPDAPLVRGSGQLLNVMRPRQLPG
jgi:phosphohistidine phosphatase